MENINLGKLIRNFRFAKGIEENKLCKGLCSEITFGHYEKGTCFMDNLLAHRFLKRMGNKTVTKNWNKSVQICTGV